MAATAASGQAAVRGISLASTANGASTDNSSKAPITQRDGRQGIRCGPDSGRKLADALDERVDRGIGRSLVAEEPAPEPIVLAFEQP